MANEPRVVALLTNQFAGHWTRVLIGGRVVGGSGYFQDMFLKAELTAFADELDVLYKTKRRVKDMEFPLFLNAVSQPSRQCLLLNI